MIVSAAAKLAYAATANADRALICIIRLFLDGCEAEWKV